MQIEYQCEHIKFLKTSNRIHNMQDSSYGRTVTPQEQNENTDGEPRSEDENNETEDRQYISLSRQFQQIIARIQSRTERNNQTVTTRQQEQQLEEEQTVSDIMCQEVRLISIQPLLFSVPYGHQVPTDRCFVYLGRDTMTLRCECSDPNNGSMYPIILLV
jgi:hypothetical protein